MKIYNVDFTKSFVETKLKLRYFTGFISCLYERDSVYYLEKRLNGHLHSEFGLAELPHEEELKFYFYVFSKSKNSLAELPHRWTTLSFASIRECKEFKEEI